MYSVLYRQRLDRNSMLLLHAKFFLKFPRTLLCAKMQLTVAIFQRIHFPVDRNWYFRVDMASDWGWKWWRPCVNNNITRSEFVHARDTTCKRLKLISNQLSCLLQTRGKYCPTKNVLAIQRSTRAQSSASGHWSRPIWRFAWFDCFCVFAANKHSQCYL